MQNLCRPFDIAQVKPTGAQHRNTRQTVGGAEKAAEALLVGGVFLPPSEAVQRHCSTPHSDSGAKLNLIGSNYRDTSLIRKCPPL